MDVVSAEHLNTYPELKWYPDVFEWKSAWVEGIVDGVCMPVRFRSDSLYDWWEIENGTRLRIGRVQKWRYYDTSV